VCFGGSDKAEDLRRRSHVKRLVESTKLAVRAAGHTSRQIETASDVGREVRGASE